MCFNKTCNKHLSFRNLNPNPTKNLSSNFQNLYIFTNGLSIESLLHPMFLFIIFFKLQFITYVFVFEGYTCCIDSQELINLYDPLSLSLSLSQFFLLINNYCHQLLNYIFINCQNIFPQINNSLIYLKPYHNFKNIYIYIHQWSFHRILLTPPFFFVIFKLLLPHMYLYVIVF